MADITSLFKATVKAIKVRETNIDQIEKSSGVNSISEFEDIISDPLSSIMYRS